MEELAVTLLLNHHENMFIISSDLLVHQTAGVVLVDHAKTFSTIGVDIWCLKRCY